MHFKYNKFALIADSHIENNKNLPYVLKAFDWIVETLKQKQIKCAFILGDFINSRDKIDSLALNKAIDVLNKFEEAGIEVFLLLGNHERYTKATSFEITSIRPFEKHATVLTDFITLSNETFNIICVPNLETNEEFVTILDTIHPEKGKLNILFAHQGIQGAVTNDLYNIYDKTGLNASLFDKFDRVFLGHYHRRQAIPKNILFVGDPVQLSHGEELSEKGITVFDASNNTSEFILNPNYELYLTTGKLEDEVSNKFVRYVTNEFLDHAQTKKIKEDFKAKGAIEVKIEVKSKELEEVLKSDNIEFDLSQIVKSFVDKNIGTLDKERCLKTYNKIREMTGEN